MKPFIILIVPDPSMSRHLTMPKAEKPIYGPIGWLKAVQGDRLKMAPESSILKKRYNVPLMTKITRNHYGIDPVASERISNG